jgi:glycosyltransferase 2 family protein
VAIGGNSIRRSRRNTPYNSLMTSTTRRWLWRGVKFLLAGLIIFFIARQFLADLTHLDFSKLELRPAWLAGSSALYLIGVYPSAWYWRHLHRLFGYPLPLYAAVRAHYIGQLGKYVPGKALALAMRADLAHPYGVPYGVSIIISFYEVLTGMAAGAIVAAVIYAFEPPGDLGVGLHPVALGLILIGLCGVPLLPGVFNFIVGKMTAKIQAVELYRLPPVRFGTLTIGLATTGAGWWLQGLSWWAVLYAVLPDPPALTPSVWAQCTASIALASVAGFASMIPGGFLVREAILTLSLRSLGAREEFLLAAAILLRLDWIVAEALFALCAYWIKPAPPMISEPEA